MNKLAMDCLVAARQGYADARYPQDPDDVARLYVSDLLREHYAMSPTQADEISKQFVADEWENIEPLMM